jgi:hypothetical protein
MLRSLPILAALLTFVGCASPTYTITANNLTSRGGDHVSVFENDGLRYLIDPQPGRVRLTVLNVGNEPLDLVADSQITPPAGGSRPLAARTLAAGTTWRLTLPPREPRPRTLDATPDRGPTDEGGLILSPGGGARAPQTEQAAAWRWPAGSTTILTFRWQPETGELIEHEIEVRKDNPNPK